MTEFNTEIDAKRQVSRGSDAILLFFLKLYKLQLSADPAAESRVEMASQTSENPISNLIYTLRVNHQGTWRSRRMTLGRLGANITNRSTCYHVIFDDLMVVKIPFQPIHEFNTYIQCVSRDWRIAQKAAPPIRCIVPSLSTVLNKIPRLHHPEARSPEEIEKRYIFLLRKEPNLQSYLKIGGSFAFFMNLSQYTFLNQEIDKIHGQNDLFPRDFLKPTDSLWETHGIDPLLIAEEDPAIFEMGHVLAEYEEWITDILGQYECDASFSTQRRRAWFTAHLSGQDLKSGEHGLPEPLIQTLPEFLAHFSEKHRETINAFRKAHRQQTEKTWRERNKGKITGIITSILSLLANLKSQELSLRDLKPENIFIVAEPERLERGVPDPEIIELGLIDLETAVALDSNTDAIEQPLCTGTPAFSTPSHLFPNPFLSKLLGDLKRTFFLQDVYAAVGLIFFAATGETLFEKTGRLLPEIVLASRKSSLKDHAPADLFQHSSWVFWHSAVNEMTRQVSHYRDALKSLKISLSELICPMLQELLEKTHDELKDRISSLLSSQTSLQKTQLEALAASDAESIRKQIHSLEENNSSHKAQTREQVLTFLSSLEHLKRLSEQEFRYREMLLEKRPSISVDDLIEFLFFTVIAFMYRESWTIRKHPLLPEKSPTESTAILPESVHSLSKGPKVK